MSKQDSQAEAEFTQFYLQQATKEFSDDLDKLRSAPDFRPTSIDVLIEALKQGQSGFDKEDRVRIGSAKLKESKERKDDIQ